MHDPKDHLEHIAKAISEITSELPEDHRNFAEAALLLALDMPTAPLDDRWRVTRSPMGLYAALKPGNDFEYIASWKIRHTPYDALLKADGTSNFLANLIVAIHHKRAVANIGYEVESELQTA